MTTATPTTIAMSLLMVVANLEEGDVPPMVASPGGAVFVHETATAKEKKQVRMPTVVTA